MGTECAQTSDICKGGHPKPSGLYLIYPLIDMNAPVEGVAQTSYRQTFEGVSLSDMAAFSKVSEEPISTGYNIKLVKFYICSLSHES